MSDTLPSTHHLRPECAKEFGKIEASLANHRRFREEVRSELRDIKIQIESLTSSVTVGVSDIRNMLAEHIGESHGVHHRIKSLESDIDNVESRLWSERLKASAITGGLVFVIEFLLSRIG